MDAKKMIIDLFNGYKKSKVVISKEDQVEVAWCKWEVRQAFRGGYQEYIRCLRECNIIDAMAFSRLNRPKHTKKGSSQNNGGQSASVRHFPNLLIEFIKKHKCSLNTAINALQKSHPQAYADHMRS